MDNLPKFVFVALSLCFISFLTSCGEYGGTIIVKNNYSTTKTVSLYSNFYPTAIDTIFSYKDKYGPKTIVAGSSDVFDVEGNIRYGIIWSDDGVDKYKVVKVSHGDTVEVNIP